MDTIHNNFKRIFAIGVIVVISLGIVVGVYLTQQQTNLKSKAGSTGVDISLLPSRYSVGSTQPFYLDVFADTTHDNNNFQVSSLELHVGYDPTKLTISDILPANQGITNLTRTLKTRTVSRLANGKDDVSITLGVTGGTGRRFFSGRQTIAKLEIRTVPSFTGSATLDLTGTKVAALDYRETVAGDLTGATITPAAPPPPPPPPPPPAAPPPPPPPPATGCNITGDDTIGMNDAKIYSVESTIICNGASSGPGSCSWSLVEKSEPFQQISSFGLNNPQDLRPLGMGVVRPGSYSLSFSLDLGGIPSGGATPVRSCSKDIIITSAAGPPPPPPPPPAAPPPPPPPPPPSQNPPWPEFPRTPPFWHSSYVAYIAWYWTHPDERDLLRDW